MKVVTVGRGPLSASLSVTQIERDGKTFLIVLVLVAASLLLLAQLPYWRYWSLFAILAFALVLVVSIALLDQAARPDGAVETSARILANPRPAAGFFVLVAGSVCGLIGSVTSLLSRRERITVVEQGAHSSQSSPIDRAAAAGTSRVQPGWFRDPESPVGQRWWDGAAWTQHRRPGQPLPPPSPPSP